MSEQRGAAAAPTLCVWLEEEMEKLFGLWEKSQLFHGFGNIELSGSKAGKNSPFKGWDCCVRRESWGSCGLWGAFLASVLLQGKSWI